MRAIEPTDLLRGEVLDDLQPPRRTSTSGADETLTKLGERYGLNPNYIWHANPKVKDPDLVKEGDTLWTIAKQIARETNGDVRETFAMLVKMNGIKDVHRIRAGASLAVPLPMSH